MLKQDLQDRQQLNGASGESFPLGATVKGDGVNFSLFCKTGTSVDLLFFAHVEDTIPERVVSLTPKDNRTYHYWHTFVAGVKPGQLYAYMIQGPFNPSCGYYYDPHKILLDPYSNAVAVPKGLRRSNLSQQGVPDCPSMKSVVTNCSRYDWEGDKRLCRTFSETIIYELHVGGFTKHTNSKVGTSRKGKFAGLAEKIPYLIDLGITAVELMPVFQFDLQDAQDGLINYWGYSPISFFAPHQGYSTSEDPLVVLDEFRDMVKAFHKAGIEVILDVVYNHTAEGGLDGPTYCFRGIENSIYYLLDKNNYGFADFSGCGNTLNANQAIVRRMIMDSLHFWVTEMHVDGFRFDLASILSRDESGSPIQNPPILWDIESDPVFAGIKLIAEAWDAAGLYQVGNFIGDSWKEWNGKFRDDIRKFLRGDKGTLSPMVTRIVGSPDIYGHQEKGPEQSINFVTCHDGFTLHDLVTFEKKHNEDNRENNRDGSNENFSWNCGVEGETNDPDILSLRNRQVKNFHVLNLLSVGAPMIAMGDEVGRTQNGNNNAYCQDNEMNWFDWSLIEKHADLFRFVKLLISARQNLDISRRDRHASLNDILQAVKITWHGIKLNCPDWSEDSHSISFTLRSLQEKMETHFLINAYHETLVFELPPVESVGTWMRWIDTSLESPDDIRTWPDAKLVDSKLYQVFPHTIVVLIRFI